MADNKSVRSTRKGFLRDTIPPADIQTRSALAPRLTLLNPADVGSGRVFRYEWEIYIAELLDRVEVIEVAGGITPGGGTGGSFVHNQATPAASWSITHNLATEPTVTVVVGNQEIWTEVQYPTVNQTVVVFNAPTAGTAYLRG